MKIIILGAGQVGGTLAENLVGENNDITVVDTDSGRLRQLQDKFDLRVVQGHGSHPRVLREAGAEDADMLVAVTNSDETNMVACQIAYSLFNTPNRIARIRAPEYIRESEKLFLPEAVPIDHLISPEQLVIDYIYKLIEYPGALQVVNFAEGKVSIAAVKAYYGGPLVGNALSSMREHMPHIDTRVAAIFRQDRPIRPQGSTIIEAGDEVFFVAASQHIRAVMSELQRLEKPYKRIMIVGGGNVGAGLAAKLEKDYNVKLIERNQQRAAELAEQLGRDRLGAHARDPPAGKIQIGQLFGVAAAQAQIVAERRGDGHRTAILGNQFQPLHRAHGEILRAQIIDGQLGRHRRQQETDQAHIVIEGQPRNAAVARAQLDPVATDRVQVRHRRPLGNDHAAWKAGAARGVLEIGDIVGRRRRQRDLRLRQGVKVRIAEDVQRRGVFRG